MIRIVLIYSVKSEMKMYWVYLDEVRIKSYQQKCVCETKQNKCMTVTMMKWWDVTRAWYICSMFSFSCWIWICIDYIIMIEIEGESYSQTIHTNTVTQKLHHCMWCFRQITMHMYIQLYKTSLYVLVSIKTSHDSRSKQ